MDAVSRRFTPVRRWSTGTLVAVALASVASLSAQVPGRNVNMVSGLTWPGGDPFLQRQNEPSVAASTRNPLHLLAGANDYRSVDLPGLPNSEETGDAWLGLFKSADGGERWESTLVPGYPQDTTPEGLASPLKGYAAAADPVVRAGTNGMFYYAGLAFDRTPDPNYPGKSAIFVARYIDNNNDETQNPIRYIGTRLVTANAGTTRQFLDKPWIAVDIPRRGGATCTVTTAGARGPITQRIPAGMVYVAYTVKTVEGVDNAKYDLYFSRSADCGETFSAPIRVSRLEDRVNQGVNLAVSPATGEVYLAWRRIDLSGDDDAIVVARSADQGRKFNPPGVARRFPRGKKKGLDPWKFSQNGRPSSLPPQEVEEISPFDQGTSAYDLSFRTNAYPTMAIDGAGRVYLAWAERGYATESSRSHPTDGDARILLATSTNGQSWTSPAVVADQGQMGHQIMPSLAFAGGKLLLAYYDLQEDRSQVFETKYIDDRTAFNLTSPDRRHTIDLRTAMAAPGATPVFAPSVRVSDYLKGFAPGVPVQYVNGKPVPSPLQANPPNLPMFKLGTAPFMGDYIDVAAAPAFVPTANGGWAYNTAAGATPPAFHVAWADNRDVRAPLDGNWEAYTPPNYAGPRPDPLAPYDACVPGRAGMRNQNIYTARVTGGLLVGSPQNAKPLSTDVQRTFVVFVQNAVPLGTVNPPTKAFRLSILNQPQGGRASFEQLPAPPYTNQSPPPLAVLDVEVKPYSTASRTVYVTSNDPDASITIDVSEIAAIGAPGELAGGLDGTIVLNPDVTNPEVDNPEVDNPEVDNLELHNPEVDNPEVDNPEVDNPEVDNPEVDNPEVDNPEVDNPEVDNIVISNPEVDNPEVDNPEVDNPEVDNPEVDNPEVDNTTLREAGGIITDVTWTLTNTGTTTTAYNTNLFLNTVSMDGLNFQLLVYRRYRTPGLQYNSCDVKAVTQNVLVANIPSPELLAPGDALSDQNDPDSDHGTVWLAPGEEVYITLRVFDEDASDNTVVGGASLDTRLATGDLTVVVQPQPIEPGALDGGATEPPPASSDPLPVFSVTTTADAGPGSLRDAMNAANLRPGQDTIVFNLPGAGPHTFVPASPLPAQAEPVVIDGTTQPGYFGSPLIVLDGNGNGGSGLRLNGGNSTVRGLAIGRFQDVGIAINDVGGNAVYANYIGVDATGGVARGNAMGGIYVTNSDNNRIGGTGAAGRNVISGNGFFGILVTGSNDNRIEGNYIGVDATGTVAIANTTGIGAPDGANNVFTGNTISGNFSNGVTIGGGSGNVLTLNRIGTNAAGTLAIANGGYGIDAAGTGHIIGQAGAGNLVSGNAFHGVVVRGTGTIVRGNRVGTNAAGTAAMGNGQIGVALFDAEGAIIGGPGAGEGNQISGNGVGVSLAFSTGTVTPAIVRGNLIGTAANGIDPVPNVQWAVWAGGTARATLGGTGAGEGNTIANSVFGVSVNNTASITIRGNSIFNQGFQAIDLNEDGPTANDGLDADGGPNLLQNYPGSLGEIFTAALQDYTIDFYSSPVAGQARTWVTSVTVTTDAAGHAFIPAVGLPAGTWITATATDAAGNTSELSPAVFVP